MIKPIAQIDEPLQTDHESKLIYCHRLSDNSISDKSLIKGSKDSFSVPLGTTIKFNRVKALSLLKKNFILGIRYGDTDLPSSVTCTASRFSFRFMFSDSQIALGINSIRLTLITVGAFWVRRWIAAVSGYNSFLDFLIFRSSFC